MPPVVETWSPNYWAAREFPLDNGSKLAHLHHCYGDALVPGEVKKWSQMKSLSRVWLSVTPWTVAYQAPLSMGFSRQEYWNGLPLPSPIAHMRYTFIHTEKTDYVPRIKLLDTRKFCSEIHRCSLFQRRWLESFQTSLFLSQPKPSGSPLQIWLTKPTYPNISSSFSHPMFWHTLINNLQTWCAS